VNARVARRYAKALFALAKEHGVTEEVGDGLGAVAEAVAEALRAEHASGALLDEDSRRRIGQRLGERIGENSMIGKFVMLVVLRGRLVEVPAMHAYYRRLCDGDAGRVRARVESARELSEAAMGAIIEVFSRSTGRTVLPEVETEAGLLGGVVVEIEGRVFDGSLRSSLARLTKQMAGEQSHH